VTASLAAILALMVLATHVAIIAFNLFGMIAIPLGAWYEWQFVRIRWWRMLHIAILAIVAVQALLGRACILTLWQDSLAGGSGHAPLIMRWVIGLIYWPLPMWFFALLYLAVLTYTLALWFLVPPRRVLGS
jgi:Protein of Unknown function (DUF2784)